MTYSVNILYSMSKFTLYSKHGNFYKLNTVNISLIFSLI